MRAEAVRLLTVNIKRLSKYQKRNHGQNVAPDSAPSPLYAPALMITVSLFHGLTAQNAHHNAMVFCIVCVCVTVHKFCEFATIFVICCMFDWIHLYFDS